MKKVSIFVAALALIIITGCTKVEKLTCTQNEQVDGSSAASLSSKSIITFEDGYATKYETTQEAVFSDEETAKEYYENFLDSEGYVVNQDGSKVTIKYSQSVSKSASRTEENKKDYIKQYLESKSFECK